MVLFQRWYFNLAHPPSAHLRAFGTIPYLVPGSGGSVLVYLGVGSNSRSFSTGANVENRCAWCLPIPP